MHHSADDDNDYTNILRLSIQLLSNLSYCAGYLFCLKLRYYAYIMIFVSN